MKQNKLILGLDISTTTTGIAIYEDLGDHGKLVYLNHVSPKIKPRPESKMEELIKKADIFDNEFLFKYKDMGITKVIIEEPLLRSNNVNTVATLLRYNGMLSRSVHHNLGIVPEFISSYDARAFGFPELMSIRTHNKKGEAYPEKELKKKKPVLFGEYPWIVDKKEVIWKKVAEMEPQIEWPYKKSGKLKNEVFDISDACCCVIGQMNKSGLWKPENRVKGSLTESFNF